MLLYCCCAISVVAVVALAYVGSVVALLLWWPLHSNSLVLHAMTFQAWTMLTIQAMSMFTPAMEAPTSNGTRMPRVPCAPGTAVMGELAVLLFRIMPLHWVSL